MESIEGIVTIVQEGRFQLLDDDGVAHHFMLGHSAAAEPEQVVPLQQAQTRVRVHFRRAERLLGHTAVRIDLLDHGSYA